MSSVYLECMLKHEVLPDGSKMTRDHAYRILATRKHYSCLDQTDHESHYVPGSREHLIYKAEQSLKLDSWIYHPSFLVAEGKKKKKRVKKRPEDLEDWQRNFHQELRDARHELNIAKEELKQATGVFWNSSNRDELVQIVNKLTEKIAFLKNKITLAATKKFTKKSWVRKQIEAMKRAGGIKISPDGNNFVFADQENAFGAVSPSITETDPDRAEKYMIYFLEKQSTERVVDDMTSDITAKEPILNALHEVTEKMASFANQEAEDEMFELFEAARFLERNKRTLANDNDRNSKKNTFAPSEGVALNRAKASKQAVTRAKKKLAKANQEQKVKIAKLIRDVSDILPEVTKAQVIAHMAENGGLIEKTGRDMLDTVAKTGTFAQKVLEWQGNMITKFGEAYENSSSGKIADRFFKKWLGDEEVDASKKSDPRTLKSACNWVNIRYRQGKEYKPTEYRQNQEWDQFLEEEREGSDDDSDADSVASDDSVATESQEPHVNQEFRDKRLCPPVHKISTDARATFLSEEFEEDRIYTLPFKASSESESQQQHEKRNHFCYDSVALSDYIVQELLSTTDNKGVPFFTKGTAYDAKCRRDLNTYESTYEWEMKSGRRKVVFTDYEFSDLFEWVQLTEGQHLLEGQIENPAWNQPNLKKLRPYMTPYFTPSIILSALGYFKGYHDIIVRTNGGINISREMRSDFEKIRNGTFVDPFKDTDFERSAAQTQEDKSWTSWAWGKIANLGYSLYNGILTWTPSIFDFMKNHIIKLQTVYMCCCAAAFVWVVSALFTTGGVYAALKSPVVIKALTNMVAQVFNSSIMTSFISSYSSFFAIAGEFMTDLTDASSTRTWFQWSVSWVPWIWSSCTNLPFDSLYNTYTIIVNMISKWTPGAILAALNIWMVVKLSGIITNQMANAAAAATPVLAASVVGAPFALFASAAAAVLKTIVLPGIAILEAGWQTIGPILVKIHYFLMVVNMLREKFTLVVTFMSGIFSGDMSPIDAIISFRYIPQMMCNWVVGMKGSLFSKHCSSIAKIIGNAATMAVVINFVLEVFMDISYFMGFGGSSGGRCGKIISGARSDVGQAQATAEKNGKGGWFFRESSKEKKEADARRIFELEQVEKNKKSDGTWQTEGAVAGFVRRNHATFKQWIEN